MKTLRAAAEATITVHRSRFVAKMHPVLGEEQAQRLIGEVRQEHPQANHVVWAYAIGPKNSQKIGMSDDREPRGTAGRPALGVLQHRELTNVLVTVVRYFGGVKLGKGGLVRAYTSSVQAAMEAASLEELVERCTIHVQTEYPWYQAIRAVLDEAGATLTTESFQSLVTLTGELPRTQLAGVQQAVLDLSAGRVQVTTEPESKPG